MLGKSWEVFFLFSSRLSSLLCIAIGLPLRNSKAAWHEVLGTGPGLWHVCIFVPLCLRPLWKQDSQKWFYNYHPVLQPCDQSLLYLIEHLSKVTFWLHVSCLVLTVPWCSWINHIQRQVWVVLNMLGGLWRKSLTSRYHVHTHAAVSSAHTPVHRFPELSLNRMVVRSTPTQLVPGLNSCISPIRSIPALYAHTLWERLRTLVSAQWCSPLPSSTSCRHRVCDFMPCVLCRKKKNPKAGCPALLHNSQEPRSASQGNEDGAASGGAWLNPRGGWLESCPGDVNETLRTC